MKVLYPVDPKKFKIIQKFGIDCTNDPVTGSFYELYDNKHPGVDFNTPIGEQVLASFEGIVDRAEFHKGMGNVVGVRNGNIVALYAHLSEIKVKAGDTVVSGQILGLSGNTGSACPQPHLHYELRDISKSPLKNMVFDPPFDNDITNYAEIVTYKVNNTNRTKTLGYLSIMYFGTEKYWMHIQNCNDLDLDKDEILPQNKNIIIPNYK